MPFPPPIPVFFPRLHLLSCLPSPLLYVTPSALLPSASFLLQTLWRWNMRRPSVKWRCSRSSGTWSPPPVTPFTSRLTHPTGPANHRTPSQRALTGRVSRRNSTHTFSHKDYIHYIDIIYTLGCNNWSLGFFVRWLKKDKRWTTTDQFLCGLFIS